jgi:hypothetical protein
LCTGTLLVFRILNGLLLRCLSGVADILLHSYMRLVVIFHLRDRITRFLNHLRRGYLAPFQIFSKILADVRSLRCTTGINDTGNCVKTKFEEKKTFWHELWKDSNCTNEKIRVPGGRHFMKKAEVENFVKQIRTFSKIT